MLPQGYKNMDLESQDPIFNANLGQDDNLIWTKKLRCSHSIIPPESCWLFYQSVLNRLPPPNVRSKSKVDFLPKAFLAFFNFFILAKKTLQVRPELIFYYWFSIICFCNFACYSKNFFNLNFPDFF